LNACFYLHFNYFRSSFYRLHIICVFPIYQYLHCSYMLNLSVSNCFFTTCLFQIVLTCLRCFISTILGTNSLSSADVPLSNKQTDTSLGSTIDWALFLQYGFAHVPQHIIIGPMVVLDTTELRQANGTRKQRLEHSTYNYDHKSSCIMLF